MPIRQIETELRAAGLVARGAFVPGETDGVPAVAPGRPTRAVVLLGNAGPAMWERFSAERREEDDPLDRWSERTVARLADKLGARAAFPFQPPYLPFQRWAVRAEPCHPSPIGLLVHPDYGLWHGYRAALLFPFELDLPAADRRSSPCQDCGGRPCLSACPVGAFDGKGYDLGRCVAHLGRVPRGDCAHDGCAARLACPVGPAFRYAPAQAEFHMAAFIRNHVRR